MATRASPSAAAAAHFNAEASYWDAVYGPRPGVAPLMYRQRSDRALRWTDALALPADAPVLDLGCGAGITALSLARRGLRVTAMDVSPAMVNLARRHAAEAGLQNRVLVGQGDVHHLGFPNQAFALVIALGVLPWLHDPDLALAEIARVLQPSAHLIATADNRNRLDFMLDPLHNVALQPLKRRVKTQLQRRGLWRRAEQLRPCLWTSAEFDLRLRRAGLFPLGTAQAGFGPFTLMGRHVLPPVAAVRLHQLLQRLCEAGAPVLRSTGATLFALAQKPPRVIVS